MTAKTSNNRMDNATDMAGWDFPHYANGQSYLDQVFEIDDRKYQFCVHCHTPKPIAQITATGSNEGICVNCVNGRNNYLRLAKRNQLPWPTAIPQPTPPAPKPAPKPADPTPPKRVKRDAPAGTTPGEQGTDAARDEVNPNDRTLAGAQAQVNQILDLNAKRNAKKR